MAEHDKPLAQPICSEQICQCLAKHEKGAGPVNLHKVHTTSKTNSWTRIHRPTFKRCSNEAPGALHQLIAVVILPRRQQIPYHCSIEDGSRLEAQELRV